MRELSILNWKVPERNRGEESYDSLSLARGGCGAAAFECPAQRPAAGANCQVRYVAKKKRFVLAAGPIFAVSSVTQGIARFQHHFEPPPRRTKETNERTVEGRKEGGKERD